MSRPGWWWALVAEAGALGVGEVRAASKMSVCGLALPGQRVLAGDVCSGASSGGVEMESAGFGDERARLLMGLAVPDLSDRL